MAVTSMPALWQAVANHLWQSTLFAAIAALLTLALRKSQARTRYWLWLAASVKFLIPFSLLVGLGSHLARPRSLIQTQPGFYFAVDQVSQPFTHPAVPVISTAASSPAHPSLIHLLPAILAAVWLCGFFAVLCVWCFRWRRISLMMRDAAPLRAGRELEALRRIEKAAGMRKPVKLLLSPASLEPGIFGIVWPALVWPEGISARLQDAHLEAILAHEICHVRRRDNLTAAMHMFVEALFWFHPLVWWLGARMMEERERACDEEVLQLGNAAQVYAESILKTCEYCLESPLACISGVTGADLKKRILAIMTERIAIKLNFTHKLLLGAAGVMAIGAPLVFGLLTNTQSGLGQKSASADTKLPAFEVVSIKLDKSGAGGLMEIRFTPDGFSATNVPLKLLVSVASGIRLDLISGGPTGLDSTRYDVEAKVAGPDVAAFRSLRPPQRGSMLQPLLADRFKLTFHKETKILPVYNLTIAKGGSKLHEAKPGDTYPNGFKGPDGGAPTGIVMMGLDKVTGQAIPIATLTSVLSQQLQRTVIDKTALTGKYDIALKWTPDEDAKPPGASNDQHGVDSAPPPDASGPSLFTALQEQLGLKLESAKGPVEVLMIDHIEPPSAN